MHSAQVRLCWNQSPFGPSRACSAASVDPRLAGWWLLAPVHTPKAPVAALSSIRAEVEATGQPNDLPPHMNCMLVSFPVEFLNIAFVPQSVTSVHISFRAQLGSTGFVFSHLKFSHSHLTLKSRLWHSDSGPTLNISLIFLPLLISPNVDPGTYSRGSLDSSQPAPPLVFANLPHLHPGSDPHSLGPFSAGSVLAHEPESHRERETNAKSHHAFRPMPPNHEASSSRGSPFPQSVTQTSGPILKPLDRPLNGLRRSQFGH